jgi:hypothetical protein
MTNAKPPEPAKKEPQRTSLTLASVVAILTGITSLVIFFTGKSTLPELLKGDAATATATATAAAAESATPTFLAETRPPETAAQATITPPPAQLTARPPTDSELESIPSIWTLTKFKELTAPGSNGYTAEVAGDSTWIWDSYFCATNEAFPEYLDSLTVELRINSRPLAESAIRISDRPGTKGWLCRSWATKLSGWPPDKSIFLEIRYTHSRATSDGRSEFAAGEYSQLLVVVVKG